MISIIKHHYRYIYYYCCYAPTATLPLLHLLLKTDIIIDNIIDNIIDRELIKNDIPVRDYKNNIISGKHSRVNKQTNIRDRRL